MQEQNNKEITDTEVQMTDADIEKKLKEEVNPVKGMLKITGNEAIDKEKVRLDGGVYAIVEQDTGGKAEIVLVCKYPDGS